jgi:hypothetical protein
MTNSKTVARRNLDFFKQEIIYAKLLAEQLM